MKVRIFQQDGYDRAAVVCQAMLVGIQRAGDAPALMPLARAADGDYDAAVFYGFRDPLPRLIADLKLAGKPAIHIDLGYFGRLDGGRNVGYHKIAVNGRHPDAYFQRIKHSSDRISKFGLRLSPWKTGGRHVLLCGMSAKHAKSEGWEPQQWECEAVQALAKVTDRPILYRPKPGDYSALPIKGTILARDGMIERYLTDCHAVVTHHSNAAIDAALAGVPSFSVCGVASVMGSSNLSTIESPVLPRGRHQWLADVGYCQFNVAEMADGTAWRHLKNEGLV